MQNILKQQTFSLYVNVNDDKNCKQTKQYKDNITDTGWFETFVKVVTYKKAFYATYYCLTSIQRYILFML